MEYKELVQKRRSENRKFLKELGLLNISSSHNCLSPIGSSIQKISSKTVIKRSGSPSKYLVPSRRSNRIKKIKPPKYSEELIEPIGATFFVQPKEKMKRDNVFGAIPGVSVGTEFSTRIEASAAGLHRPTVAGIHGNPSLGCYSLALSGGYEDDIDLGESFIYTGEGGRDLKGTKSNPKNLRTAPQSKDQVLERGNLALTLNIKHKLPVRVIRGYKLKSKYAPNEGYRYDGLYNVVEYYITKGLSGFNVYKFRLERVKDQEPAPWIDDVEKNEKRKMSELSPKTDVKRAE